MQAFEALSFSTRRAGVPAPRRAARGVVSRRTLNRLQAAVEQEVATGAKGPVAKKSDGLEEIYIGFEKYDYNREAGRKGRVVVDDPKKYPNKDDFGFFIGVAGGWAGGEAALKSMVVEENTKVKAPAATKEQKPKALSKGKDVIYVGFGKNELELKKSGAKGRFVIDDARKYPDKEDVGFLTGAAGGFAGGEVGLKQFVESGDIRLRPTSLPVTKQNSAITIAGLLVLAGAGGGLLLNTVADFGEEVVKDDIVQAPIDDKTKILLLTAVALLTGAGVIGGTRAIVQNVSESIRDNAQRLALFGAFWMAVFFAARAVLES